MGSLRVRKGKGRYEEGSGRYAKGGTGGFGGGSLEHPRQWLQRPVGRPLPASAELPIAARRAVRRRRSRTGALPRGHFGRVAVPVFVAVSASYVTCGSLDHFLMVASGMPAASSTLPNGSSAIATPSQLVRSARPSNGDADACTALSPPLHGAFSPSFSQSAAMMPRSAPSGASLGSVGPRTEPRKSSHLDGQRRWRRRPWAGTRAPPQPLSGVHAARAQPQASGRAEWSGERPHGAASRGVLTVRVARELRRVELDDVVVDAGAGRRELAAHRHEEGVERVVPATCQLGVSE